MSSEDTILTDVMNSAKRCAYCHFSATLIRHPIRHGLNGNTRYIESVICQNNRCPKPQHFTGKDMTEAVNIWNAHMASVPPSGTLALEMFTTLKQLQHAGSRQLAIFDEVHNDCRFIRVACCPYCRGLPHPVRLHPWEKLDNDNAIIGHDADCKLSQCVTEWERTHA